MGTDIRPKTSTPKSRPPLDQRLRRTIEAWTYIIGLSIVVVSWSLIAWATIGNAVAHQPDFALPNIIPASAPYNSLDYQKLQR